MTAILTALLLAFTLASCAEKDEALKGTENAGASESASQTETVNDSEEGSDDLQGDGQDSDSESVKWEILSDTVWDDSDADRIAAHRHPNMYTDVADKSDAAYYICVFGDRGLYRETGEVDYANMKFDPDGKLTIEVALAALHRMEMGADNADSDEDALSEIDRYSDVDPEAWYACHVAWAVDCGIVEAEGDTFGVGEEVTNEALSVLIGRYAEIFQKKLKRVMSPAEVFADTDMISEEAKDYAENLRLAGVFRGDVRRMFNPSSSVTRAEAARIFVKLDEALDYTSADIFGSEEIGCIELVMQRDGGRSPITVRITDEEEVKAAEKLLREAEVTYTCSEGAFSGVGTYIKMIGKDNKLICTYLLRADGVAEYGKRYYELGEDYLKSITDRLREVNA